MILNIKTTPCPVWKGTIAVSAFLLAFPANAFAAGIGGNPWWALFWTACNFCLFVILARYLYNKHAAKLIKARSARVSEHIGRARATLAEAEHSYGSLKERLNNIQIEKQGLFERYNDEGRRQATLLLEGAHQSAITISADADRQVDRELSQTSKSLRAEVVSKALARAEEKLVKISEEDDKRLREEALEKFLKADSNLNTTSSGITGASAGRA